MAASLSCASMVPVANVAALKHTGKAYMIT